MVISNINLVKIAAIGGIATVTMGIAFKMKLNNNVKNTVYCKEALKLLRSDKAAVHLLGEPIKDRSIDVANEQKNYTKENSAKYEIPVKGPKQKGILYFWASRVDKNEWTVDRVELALQNEPDKVLLIKNNTPSNNG